MNRIFNRVLDVLFYLMFVAAFAATVYLTLIRE